MTNFEKTVAAMSPQDMELLIRTYVRRHIRSLGDGYDDQIYFRLGGATVREGRNPDPVKWHLSSGNDTADGEVLSVVAEEFYRRKVWTASNAAGLLLLEGSRTEEVVATPAVPS